MRTLATLIIGFAIAWSGSYLAFRWNHADPGGLVKTTTVTYPIDQPVLLKIFEPLSRIDAKLTGTRSRIEGDYS